MLISSKTEFEEITQAGNFKVNADGQRAFYSLQTEQHLQVNTFTPNFYADNKMIFIQSRLTDLYVEVLETPDNADYKYLITVKKGFKSNSKSFTYKVFTYKVFTYNVSTYTLTDHPSHTHHFDLLFNNQSLSEGDRALFDNLVQLKLHEIVENLNDYDDKEAAAQVKWFTLAD